MILARPLHESIAYANQDCDERQALLCDLQANPTDYLQHPDGYVRSLADWTMELYKLRSLRPETARDVFQGERCLDKLYVRLRVLATFSRPVPKETSCAR